MRRLGYKNGYRIFSFGVLDAPESTLHLVCPSDHSRLEGATSSLPCPVWTASGILHFAGTVRHSAGPPPGPLRTTEQAARFLRSTETVIVVVRRVESGLYRYVSDLVI